jgi:hypothetical protein
MTILVYCELSPECNNVNACIPGFVGERVKPQISCMIKKKSISQSLFMELVDPNIRSKILLKAM